MKFITYAYIDERFVSWGRYPTEEHAKLDLKNLPDNTFYKIVEIATGKIFYQGYFNLDKDFIKREQNKLLKK